MRRPVVAVLALALFAAGAAADPSLEPQGPRDPSGRPPLRQADALLSRLPLAFETNRGQAPEGWDFLARCRGYVAFVGPTRVVFSMDGAPLSMSLVGAAPCAPQTSGLELEGRANYFLGNDPAKWVTDVPLVRGVSYPEAAPGTTWSFGGRGRALDFAFELAPGLDGPRLAIEGAKGLRVADDGTLRAAMPHGEAVFSAPQAWQGMGASKLDAAARFVIDADGAVRVAVTPRDPRRSVHIDPSVTYESYLGGSDEDQCVSAAIDGSGNAYFSGLSRSSNFPTTSGAYRTTRVGNADAFVTKVNPTGSALIYSTYLGGNAADDVLGSLLLDSSGNAYVSGYSGGSGYPTTPGVIGPSPFGSGNGVNNVMTELGPSGTNLVFSTYLPHGAGKIAYGPSGSLYVVDSIGVSKYSAGATSQLFYRQILPTGPLPNGGLALKGIGSDPDGNVYYAGETNYYLTTTSGAYQAQPAGGTDVFVGKLDSNGATVYFTYIGGSSGDSAADLDVNLAGQAYVVGMTQSSNFPVTVDAYRSTITTSGQEDGFVTRLNANGSALRYSTYLGSGYGRAIRVHPGSSFAVGGTTFDSSFPVSSAFQDAIGGGQDGYVRVFNRDNTIAWSSFCGGSQSDGVSGLGMAPNGSLAIGGTTYSADLPTWSPYQASPAGQYECFLIVVPDTLPTVTLLGVGTSTLPTWTVGYSYSQQLAPSGGVGPYTWSLVSGTLPAGATLSSSGEISGTLTQTGTFTFKVHVDDAAEMLAERQLSIRVNPPPSITAAALPAATIATPYDRPVPITDGSGTMVFVVTSGSTPPGTSLQSDGRVTGTPAQTGDFAFTVRVTDGRGATGSRAVSLRVNPRPSIDATIAPPCTEGRLYSFIPSARDGSPPFTWTVVAGGLPVPAAVDAATGRVAGSAKTPATYGYTLRATDSAGATIDRGFTTIVSPWPQITSTSLRTAAVGRPYAALLGRSGGTLPLGWSVALGALPAGLSLDAATGSIAGTPTAERFDTVILECHDACGASVSAGFAFAAAAPVDLTRRRWSEKIEFTATSPAVAFRYLELTGGATLSFEVKGGATKTAGQELRLYDATGAEIDLAPYTKSKKGVVRVAGLIVPSTGRYFLTCEPAGGFVGKLSLTARAAPRTSWPGALSIAAGGTSEVTFAAPPGAKLSVSAKGVQPGDALPRIAAIIGPDGADLVPGGKSAEKGRTVVFSTRTKLLGGDHRVVLSARDGTAGDVAWTVKLAAPGRYDFGLPDLPAGD